MRILGISAFYHDSLDIHDPQQRIIASHRLISKMPTIAAMAYKYSAGQPFMYPQNHLGYAENFLYMMFSTPTTPYKVNPIIANALDKIVFLPVNISLGKILLPVDFAIF